ncbi:MAG: tol-pal system protein YbgF [Nitrospirota bacterium]
MPCRGRHLNYFGHLFLVLLVLAGGAGCVTTGDELRNDMAAVQMDTLGQRKEVAQLKASIAELERELAAVKEQNLGALRESQSSLLSQSSDLSKEVQLLKGRFDENRYFIDKALKDSLSERELQAARVASLENELKDIRSKFAALSAEFAAVQQAARAQAQPQPLPDGAQQEGAPAMKGTPEAGDSASSQRFYDDAQIDLKEKRFGEAREKFERFVKDFPQHTLAPNAQFWIGESYYGERKYEDAILSHENFLKKYPDHDKSRGAMLKQAYSFIELGDRKTGKVILERLIEKYPQSAEAELAEKKIAEVLGSQHKNAAPARNTKKKK